MNDELETAARFAGLADAYDRYRPGYPAATIAAVLDGLAAPADVVDVGAGTGISSRALRDAGARVVAIEPNDEMRALAVASGIDARAGRADATGLPDASADVVAAFQAFHWFTNRAALDEFARILRPDGRIALVWNERDTRGDGFTREVREIEKRFGDERTLAGADFYDETLESLLHAAGFSRTRRLRFENDQRLDREGLFGRIASTSYMPRSGPKFVRTRDALAALYASYADDDGYVTILYYVDVILGER